jgi:hypothetical protein
MELVSSVRAAGLAAAMLAGMLLGACRIDAVFDCERDDQCQLRGQIGACAASGYCTFPDPSCDSGSRYDDRAGGSYGGTCTTTDGVDAGVDTPTDPDPDHDGIISDDDNCPLVANADQHDEDSDAIGDACDLCPQLAAPQLDDDGDLIGNDCDPRPSIAGDRLVRFDGFATAGIPSAWSVLAGSASDWQGANDALETNADVTEILAFDPANSGGHQTIDVAVRMTAQGASVPAVSALFDLDSGVTDYFLCTIFTSSSPLGNPGYAAQHFTGGTFNMLATDATNGPSLPSDYRIVGSNVAGNQACKVAGATSRTLTGTDAGGADTRVGIRIRNVHTAVKYLAIYASP